MGQPAEKERVVEYVAPPTITRFHKDETRIRGVRGPVGSGKSTGMCWEILSRASRQAPEPDGIRRTKWAIIRNCYDDQTEVLTERRGWLLFKDLSETDRVATLKDNLMTFEKPSYYYAAPLSGEMISLKNQIYDLLVTPGHKLWVKERHTRKKIWEEGFKPMKARDAYGKGQTLRMMNAAEWEGGSGELSEDFFEFLGFWFAEGSVSHIKRKDCSGYHWRLVVSQKNDDGYVSDLLTRNGFSFGINDKGGNNCNFSVYIKEQWVKDLISELCQYGKARTKWLPLYIKTAPSSHLKRFLYGYMKGDGHFKGTSKSNQKDCDHLYTASTTLADDLQEIIAKSGKVAVKNYDQANNSWVLTILGDSKKEPVIAKKAWSKVQYDGWVYCVEVSTHVILVRRNGKQIWSMQTYRELSDTTLATWQHWFPEGTIGSLNRSDMVYKIRHGDVEADVLFRALDKPGDVRKLLSLELTGAWVNEAREIGKGIVDVLGDRVGRYPATDHKRGIGPTWSGIFMDTNPPDDDHWWYNLAEIDKPPGYKFYSQPGGLREINGKFYPNPKAENLDHLESGYYLKRMHGKTQSYIRVYYCNQYGFLVDGRPIYPEYVDAVHCAPETIPPVSGIPLYVGIDFGLCYTDDTEVLTKAGWKLFKDVDVDTDLAATRNPQTGAMEYTKINFKVEQPYHGEMLEWKSSEVNFCVTPEHRVPFTYRDSPGKIHFRSAEWLADHMGGHHYVDVVSDWQGSTDHELPCGMSLDVYAEFMGWWCSDGSLERDTNRISITQVKPQTRPVLEDFLKRTGFNWHKDDAGFRCSDPGMAEHLRTVGRLKQDRRVPQIIKDSPPETIKIFIGSYTLGDGGVRDRENGSQEHTVYLPTMQLADDMMELAQKAGWNSSLRVQKGQTSMLDGREIVSGNGWVITFKKSASRAELLKKNFQRYHYSGFIYCLNVPYHTLYVRRGGKPSWNGNTPAAVFGQRLASGRWIWLDELVTEDLGATRFAELLGPKLREDFAGLEIRAITGDPAGDTRSEVDESTCFQILNNRGIPAKPANTNDFVVRRESVAGALTRMVDGKPGLIISPKAKTLRKGMAGGYCRKRVQVTGQDRFRDAPDKENIYSHVCEAGQYLLLGAGEGDNVLNIAESGTGGGFRPRRRR